MPVVITMDQRATAELDRVLRDFHKLGAKVARRALNRAGRQVESAAADAITKELPIKKSDLRGKHTFGGITLRRATDADPTVAVSIIGRRIALEYLKAKQLRATKVAVGNLATRKVRRRKMSGGAGVRYAVGRRFMYGAFMAQGAAGVKGQPVRRRRWKRSDAGQWSAIREQDQSVSLTGGTGVKVFARKPGSKRLPIYRPKGPSVAVVAERSPTLLSAVQGDISETLLKRLEHELEWALQSGSASDGE